MLLFSFRVSSINLTFSSWRIILKTWFRCPKSCDLSLLCKLIPHLLFIAAYFDPNLNPCKITTICHDKSSGLKSKLRFTSSYRAIHDRFFVVSHIFPLFCTKMSLWSQKSHNKSHRRISNLRIRFICQMENSWGYLRLQWRKICQIFGQIFKQHQFASF